MIEKLSYNIDENTPMYGGKKGFIIERTSSIEKGDSANTSFWSLPNHLGTHIDLPHHFHIDGKKIDDFHSDFWFFNGNKIQLLDVKLPKKELLIKPEHIDTNDLKFDAELLLLKTGFHKYRDKEEYWKNNPGVSIEFVKWLKQNFKNLRVIGMDFISLSSWQHRDAGREVHKILLDPKKSILPIEDMNLSKIGVDTVFNKVIVAPLMVNKSDGTPCTVFAEVEKK